MIYLLCGFLVYGNIRCIAESKLRSEAVQLSINKLTIGEVVLSVVDRGTNLWLDLRDFTKSMVEEFFSMSL